MRILFKDLKKDMLYTIKHKGAYLKTQREKLGRITIEGLLHDCDKLFLYLLFTKKETSKIHRSYSKHHVGNHKREKDIINALIDWECARYTKPDKQETAREYLEFHIPQYKSYYEPFLKKLNL